MELCIKQAGPQTGDYGATHFMQTYKIIKKLLWISSGVVSSSGDGAWMPRFFSDAFTNKLSFCFVPDTASSCTPTTLIRAILYLILSIV